ncbi:MAG: hypothetical protein IIA45_01030 [Bacteroidetes bacterium]|nr:hypothetical protein [Bacteroidota bacterium]
MNENELKVLQLFTEEESIRFSVVEERFTGKISQTKVNRIMDQHRTDEFLKHTEDKNAFRITELGKYTLEKEIEKRDQETEKETQEGVIREGTIKLNKWQLFRMEYWWLLMFASALFGAMAKTIFENL